MKKLITFFIIIAISISSITCIFAQNNVNSNDEKTKEDELNENLENQGKTQEEINKIQAEIDNVIKEVQRVQVLIDQKNKEISDLNSQMDQEQEKITKLEMILSLSGEEYEGQNEIFKTRIRGIYELGVLGFWDMLFTSKSIPEFIRKYDVITKLISYDRDLLATLSNQKGNLDQTKRDLDTRKGALKFIKDHKQELLNGLEKDKSDQNAILQKLWDNKGAVELMLKTQRDEEQKIRDTILKEKEEEERKLRGDDYTWPVPGHYIITSPYGERIDPITGTHVYHNGMDIGAPEGADIVACKAGRVIRMMNDGGYNGGLRELCINITWNWSGW